MRCRVTFVLLCTAVLATLAASVSVKDKVATVTIYASPPADYRVALNQLDPAGIAWARFEDTLNVTGWGILNIKTNGQFSDAQQAYAAGLAEGVLTAGRIYEQYLNIYATTFGPASPPSANLTAFLDAQDAWTRSSIAQNPTDQYWMHVHNIIQQFDALMDGYNRAWELGVAAVPPLDRFAFQMLNGVGDLFDIIPATDHHQRPQWERMTNEEVALALAKRQHCSALIKVTGNYSDLFMGHSSFFTYSATNRIFKHYHFSYSNNRTGAQRVSFSSYPGFLESLDDFYMMDSGLGMVQTTIGFSNNSLYNLIRPESLLAWQRVRLASAMARTAPEWYDVYRQHYSGTYTNQYMVVDFNLFQPYQPLQDNTLWVVEEIPGMIPGSDQTATLRRGYWPSYNVPFYPQTFTASGFANLAARGVPSASYELAPRANIFRRDQGSVVDFESYKHIMRYNDWQKDPYSLGNSDNAICARGDLSTEARAGGCYDTKATNFQRIKKLHCEAINGPTYQDQPAFSWTGPFATDAHIGLPLVYNFTFIEIQAQDPTL
eukprot:TRINITY_DN69491_c0_g1_i1.p1 TRINITY_DN69491_c0_g1~~TRINITY_DN69491_c0_g1_i1.p1  ORF type:complete len:546 (+),score=119.16 TRINITY_DN69491_c0_g1_i1:26-1663(+)